MSRVSLSDSNRCPSDNSYYTRLRITGQVFLNIIFQKETKCIFIARRVNVKHVGGENKMKKFIVILALLVTLYPSVGHAQSTYTVRSGDSLWKIAVRYQIGIDEIINANKQIPNPNLIYPNQKINIPNIDEVKAIEKEVIRLTNVKRQQNGVAPLKENWELSRVARYKSADMNDNHYFSHTSPTYGSPFTMIKNFGISYRSAGENIAQGQRTANEVVNTWWNSAGHRKNMLNPSFTQIGVGKDGTYWTQQFIGK